MKLLDAIEKYQMIRNEKILRSLILNRKIIENSTIIIDENSKALTIEYWLPYSEEFYIFNLSKEAGLKIDEQSSPVKLAMNFLYSLSSPIYQFIAEAKNWPTKWVNKKTGFHISSKSPDTKISIKMRPFSKKEKKQYIIDLIINYCLSFELGNIRDRKKQIELIKSGKRVAKAEDDIFQELNAIKKQIQSNKQPTKKLIEMKTKEKELNKILAIQQSILDKLKDEGIIDNNFDTGLSTRMLKKKIKLATIKLAGKDKEHARVCKREGCGKIFIPSRSDHYYCGVSCRYQAWRKRKTSKH